MEPQYHEFHTIPKKFKLLDKRGFELPETRRAEIPAHKSTPIYKLSLVSMVWNICVGHPGLAAWLCSLPAPAHRLISWIWETGEKSLIS